MLDAPTHAAFCRHEDEALADEQRHEAFEGWMQDLSDAERGELALDYLDQLKTASGVVRSTLSRAPWFGQFATVGFNGIESFEAWAKANRWPARAQA